MKNNLLSMHAVKRKRNLSIMPFISFPYSFCCSSCFQFNIYAFTYSTFLCLSFIPSFFSRDFKPKFFVVKNSDIQSNAHTSVRSLGIRLLSCANLFNFIHQMNQRNVTPVLRETVSQEEQIFCDVCFFQLKRRFGP